MNFAVRYGVPVALATVLFFLSSNAAFADFEVTITVFPINASNASAVSASGFCNLEGLAVEVVFDDGNGHTASPSIAPTCIGGAWVGSTDVTGLDDGILFVDVSQTDGVDTYSSLDNPVSKDTVPPTVDAVFVGDGTFTGPDYNFDGTYSIDANGYIFTTSTPTFDFTSSDVATATCQIDSGAIENCDSYSYTSPSIADGSHTLHLIGTDDAGNAASSVDVDFCVDACGGGDTTPPVIDAHADVTEEATSASGATAAYTAPTVTDDTDPDFLATCLPASGAVFALGTTTVTCNASDTALNAATSTTFAVIVVDTTAPVIALTGASSTSLTVGDSFTDEGAVASDAVTASVSVSVGGSVNTASAGTYVLTYSATDDAGNVATEVTRTITVEAAPPPPTPTPTASGGGGGSGDSIYPSAPTLGAVPLPATVAPQGAVLGVQTTNTPPIVEESVSTLASTPAPSLPQENTETAGVVHADVPQMDVVESLDQDVLTEPQQNEVAQMAAVGMSTKVTWNWLWLLLLLLALGGTYWAWRVSRNRNEGDGGNSQLS